MERLLLPCAFRKRPRTIRQTIFRFNIPESGKRTGNKAILLHLSVRRTRLAGSRPLMKTKLIQLIFIAGFAFTMLFFVSSRA